MSRRGKGEGCITKRKDGSWQASIKVGVKDNGKDKRKYFYGKTRKEVQEKLTKSVHEVNQGTYTEPSKLIVGEWLDTWINEYMKNNIRQNTWKSYETQIRVHIKPEIGQLKLSKLNTSHVQALLNCKFEGGRKDGKEGGLSNRSIKYIHTVLHSALEQALKENIIMVNPCNAIKMPKKDEEKKIMYLTLEQVRIFLEYAKESRFYSAYVLALNTGLRRGEIVGLKWDCIDFEKATLAVKLNAVITNEGTVLSKPKTKSSIRTIPVPQSALKELKRHQLKQLEYKNFHMRGAYEEHDMVFPNEFGKPMDPNNFARNFNGIMKRIKKEHTNFPDITLHCLRHTFATLSLESGIPAKTIQEILGHSTISMTLDLYSHVTEKMKFDASEKINKIYENCM